MDRYIDKWKEKTDIFFFTVSPLITEIKILPIELF